MGTGAGSSQPLVGRGDKYTELQGHAKTLSPLIFLKQKANVRAAWGGQFPRLRMTRQEASSWEGFMSPGKAFKQDQDLEAA